MSQASDPVAGAQGYRALGVIDNPFKSRHEGLAQAGGSVALEAHAAATRLMAAIDAEAATEDTTPVLVRKSATVPTYYNMAGVAETTFALGDNDEIDVLGLYLPLVQMKTGRVRSAVSGLAERMAEDQFDRTLAVYTAALLAEPDEELPEYEGIADLDRDALIAEFEENPVVTTERYFGACESAHRDSAPVEVVIADTVNRSRDLEADPEATDEAEEDVPIGEGYVAPVSMTEDEMAGLMGIDGPEAAEALEGTADGDGEAEADEPEGPVEEPEVPKTPEELLVDYVVAHTGAHLSPVVARGIAAYRDSGTVATAQEWKITKAPRKTLTALCELAAHRYRRVVLIWDQFDAWNHGMHPEWKIKILSAFTEMRFAMGDNGLLVLMVQEGQAPEVEQQFGTGFVVDWDMPELERLRADPDLLDTEIVRAWVASAVLPDGDEDRGVLEGLDTLIEAADGSLERFQRMASAAVEDAAARGVSTLDDEAIAAARATGD